MPAKGFFELYPEMRPRLTAGPYMLATDHDLTAAPPDNDPGELAVDGSDFTFRVISPRYTMPPDQILSTFPPATAVGDWRSRLPQIVFKRRTLPWERDPDLAREFSDDAEHAPPWLALVVLAEGEFALSSGGVPVAQCVTSGTHLPDASDVDTANGRYLEVRQSVVNAIFPTVDDLRLLSHVRKVNLDDTELAINDDDGYMAVTIANRLPQPGPGLTSIRYTACLINVEAQLDRLPTTQESDSVFEFDHVVAGLIQTEFFTEPPDLPADVIVMQGPSNLLAFPKGPGDASATTFAGGKALGIEAAAASYALGPAETDLPVASAADTHLIEAWKAGTPLGLVAEVYNWPIIVLDPMLRFPALATWEFVCTGDGGFEALMEALDSGLIGTDELTVDPALRQDIPTIPPELRPETTATGHIGLDRTTRQGEPARAWYRGPLVPQPTERTRPDVTTGALPLHHTGDQLRRVVPDGREDVGLASAFEIGRLLALSHQSIVAKMIAWREELFGAARVKELAAAVFDALIPDFSTVMLENRSELEQLIASKVIINYAAQAGKVFGRAAAPFPGSRVPDIVAETRPADVLTGLGLDAGELRAATKQFGLAGLARFAPGVTERPDIPLSESELELKQLRTELGAHLDQIALEALGDRGLGRDRIEGASGARRTVRHRDALDRMIDRANARRNDEGLS